MGKAKRALLESEDRKATKKLRPLLAEADVVDKVSKNDKDIEALEDIVFGRLDSDFEASSSEEEEHLVVSNRKKVGRSAASDGDSDEEDHHGSTAASTRGAPVWHDSDDDEGEVDLAEQCRLKKLRNFGNQASNGEFKVTAAEYQKRLRLFHLSRTKAGEWAESLRQRKEAEATGLVMDDSDEECLRAESRIDESRQKIYKKGTKFVASSMPILGKKHLLVSPNQISFRVLPDANQREAANCSLKAIGFIPMSDRLFAAGRDKTVRVFKIDGKDNPKVVSIHLSETPIRDAISNPSNNKDLIILTSYKNLSQLDLETQQVTNVFRSMFGSRSVQKLHRLIGRRPNKNFGGSNIAISADNGQILLCDLRMKSLAKIMRMNAPGFSLTWHPKDSSKLFSGDHDGMIYQWDLISGRCLQKFYDEGSIGVESLSAGSSGIGSTAYLAAGSSSGFVNIYDISQSTDQLRSIVQTNSTSFMDDEELLEQENRHMGQLSFYTDSTHHSNNNNNIKDVCKPVYFEEDFNKDRKPLKTLGHLTTKVTSLLFHPSCRLLAMGSKMAKEGLKLVNVPSFNVYSNFPARNRCLHLKYPMSICFNDNGSLMAIGNDHGQVKLFQLPQFSSKVS